jgi:hypothetical protein
MARAKPKGKKPPPQRLPLADQDILDRLSTELTDYTSRTISGSAVIRALIRYAGQQPYQWDLSALSPLVEQEMGAGVLWGKKR